jgi:multiple sugar transport system permease protein
LKILKKFWAKPGKAALTLAAALMAFFFLIPMVYTVISSLKPLPEIFEFPIRWIPRHVRLQNFSEPFMKRDFSFFFLNSIVVAVAVTLPSLFFGSLAGYSLAKFEYRGRNLMFILVLLTMMVPIEVTMVPLAIIVKNLGWMDTYRGLIIPVMISPFGVFWIRQFILTLPNDYADAARIDGHGEFGIFIKIIMPLCTPALGALTIFTFMGNWNSLVWPMIVATRQELRTIPVGLVAFEGEFTTLWNELFAMSVAAVIPTLVLFLFLRGKLIKGMAMVGIKG